MSKEIALNVTIADIFIESSIVSDKLLSEGAILTPPQKELIKTHMVAAGQMLCNLDYDPAEPLRFTQAHASLKGQLAAYQYLLEVSKRQEEVAEETALLNQQSTQ